MDYRKYIDRDPEIMVGKPFIKGTRISVEHIIRKLGGGYSVDDVLSAYPHLTKEQIYAVLNFTAETIAHEESIELA